VVTKEARFCVACGTALAATEPSQQGGPAPDDAAGSGFIGRMVAGRYRILNKLGEGGMGAVYRAEQISLKRIVALKVLKPELSAEPGLVRRFNAEAELAAKLNHPNTVTLYDFGQDEDGALFIAMEFLEGRSLRELLQGGPLLPARALAICDQICASLSDAHGRGIVHRDLKPDNVMLIQIGKRSDVVRVLDFGIAKLRDEQGDITAMPMTRAGDLLGTPQYMAPEQIRGETVDARTDVYALGAMIYEMVTGRLPFEGPSLMAILSKHLTELPVPPHIRRADLFIPVPLSHAIMDALQKLPEARPPTMEALSERLTGLGLHAPPAPSGIGPPLTSGAGSRMPSPVPGYPPAFYSSPPPGVPLLRTPLPGSAPPPYPSPAPVQPSPYPGPPSDPAMGTYRIDRPGSGGRNLVIAIVMLVLIGGGLAIFLAARNQPDDSRAAVPADPAPTPSPAPIDPAPAPAPTVPGDVATDFSVTPSRPLYDPDNPSSPHGAAPAVPDDGVWKGGWWREPSGLFQIEVPAGFSHMNVMGMVSQFAGSCGSVPCVIRAVSFPTPGQTIDVDQVMQLLGQLPMGTGAEARNVRKQKIGGRRCALLEFDNPQEGFTGEMALCPGPGLVPAIAFQAFPSDFAATKKFRSTFFAKKIKF
jgi:serine/threonine protein kinase